MPENSLNIKNRNTSKQHRYLINFKFEVYRSCFIPGTHGSLQKLLGILLLAHCCASVMHRANIKPISLTLNNTCIATVKEFH